MKKLINSDINLSNILFPFLSKYIQILFFILFYLINNLFLIKLYITIF